MGKGNGQLNPCVLLRLALFPDPTAVSAKIAITIAFIFPFYFSSDLIKTQFVEKALKWYLFSLPQSGIDDINQWYALYYTKWGNIYMFYVI